MRGAEKAVYLPTEILVCPFKFSAEMFITSSQIFFGVIYVNFALQTSPEEKD
jgi:hypothetical protein